VTAVFFLDVILREVAEGPTLTLTASEAADLEAGSRVWVAGVPAGRVVSVRFRRPEGAPERRVAIRAVLQEDVAGLLREDATALIRAAALLAPSVIALEPGSADRPPFDFSDTLLARLEIDQDDVMRRADSLSARLDELAPLAERLGERLRDGEGTLAALHRNPEPIERLLAAQERLQRLGARTREGSAVRVLEDSLLSLRLERVLARAESLGTPAPGSDRARATEARADLTRALERVAVRMDTLEARLARAEGTAGRLMHDRALERERRLLEARADSVIASLLADPFRWLRIKLF